MEREKELGEELEMSKYMISTMDPDKKFNLMQDFEARYEHQVNKWKNRRDQAKQIEEHYMDNPEFKPKINKKSRELAKDLEKIENRMSLLN